MNNQFEVIKGNFMPDEAREILLSIINKKIDFHNIKNLSSEIRLSKPDQFSQERIRSLRKISDQIKELIKQAKDADCELAIESTIQLALVPKSEMEKA